MTDHIAIPASDWNFPAQSARKPRILLIATMPWLLAARLVKKLRLVGFDVEAVCHPGHLLGDLRDPIRRFRLSFIDEAASIEQAVAMSAPDLLLPCDDPAVTHLHALHRRDRSDALSALIERSLGDPAHYGTTTSRSALLALARSMGLRVPEFHGFLEPRHLRHPEQLSYPCVLKRDQTWSGSGTAVVARARDLRKSWSWIGGWISFMRATKVAIRDRRPRTLLDRLSGGSVGTEIQELVPGSPANRAVVCHAGKVLDGFSVVALQTAFPGGPSSVVRVIDHPEMTAATAAMVDRLGLSGFCGFDFMIDPENRAYLIELNPRATPVCHLALKGRISLPAALYRSFAGREPEALQREISDDVIALCPTEWQRDRSSEYLRQAHHDLPQDEPALRARYALPQADETDQSASAPIELKPARAFQLPGAFPGPHLNVDPGAPSPGE